MWKRWGTRTPTKCSSPVKNCYDLCKLQGYGHTMSIVRNKHWGDSKKSLIMSNSGMYTSSKKWIKTKMKKPIHLNNKGNEVITRCSFNIWSCLFLNNHHYYMCYHRRYSLHHIYASWVNNDDVHQSSEVVSDDKNIHLLSSVVKEKMGDLPINMCSNFQNNSCDNIPKCIMGCCTFTLARH